MFTEKDYADYFNQIGWVEKKMVYGTYELAGRLNVSQFSSTIQKIGNDEIRHYGYVLRLLELTAKPQTVDSRCSPRENCLGIVTLRVPAGGEAKGGIFNLSKTGVCLECDRQLQAGEIFDLSIRLFESSSETACRGRIVWCKQVRPDFFVAGIHFADGPSGR